MSRFNDLASGRELRRQRGGTFASRRDDPHAHHDLPHTADFKQQLVLMIEWDKNDPAPGCAEPEQRDSDDHERPIRTGATISAGMGFWTPLWTHEPVLASQVFIVPFAHGGCRQRQTREHGYGHASMFAGRGLKPLTSTLPAR